MNVTDGQADGWMDGYQATAKTVLTHSVAW